MRIRKVLFSLMLIVFASTFFIKDIKAAAWVEPTTYTEIDTIEGLMNSGTAAGAFYQSNRIWFYHMDGGIYLYNLKQSFASNLQIEAKQAYIDETGVTPAFLTIKPQDPQNAYYIGWTYNHGEGAEVQFQFAIWNSSGQITSYWNWTYTVRTIHGLQFVDNIVPLIDSGSGSLVASRNLLDLVPKEFTKNGITFTIGQDNTVTINGTASSGVDSYDTKLMDNLVLNGQYTLKGHVVSGTWTTGVYFDIRNTTVDQRIFYNSQFGTFTSTNRTVWFSASISLGTTVNNLKIKFQLEKNSFATDYIHPKSIYYSTATIQGASNPESVEEIMSNVYAIDDVDGNITDRIQVVDTAREYAVVLANRWKLNINEVLAAYDNSTLNIQITNTITFNRAYIDAQWATYQSGTYWYNLDNETLIPYGLTESYKFWAYVGDTAGNYTFLEVNVFLNDVTAPVWSDSNVYTVSVGYKVTYDLNTWLQSLIVTDNYDTSVTITIVTDNYTTNKAVLGSYTVVVRATDDTGNTADKTFTFTVIDNVKPVFSGPETIYKPQSGTMTISDIKGRFTAFDEISGNVTSRITVQSDNYTGFGHLEGTYYVTLKVTDIAGNIQFLTFPIIVKDDIPPVLYVADGYFITVSSAYVLTLEGIKDILVATGRLTIVSTTWYDVVLDEYTANKNTPGVYTVSIRFSQTSGLTEVHSVAVNVVNTSGGSGGIIDGPSGGMNITFILVGVGVVGVVLYLIFRRK